MVIIKRNIIRNGYEEMKLETFRKEWGIIIIRLIGLIISTGLTYFIMYCSLGDWLIRLLISLLFAFICSAIIHKLLIPKKIYKKMMKNN